MNKYKSHQGAFLTDSLFYELAGGRECAIYTLKDEDITRKGKLYLSLKQLFIAEGDPTGYSFSQKYLGGYRHWTRLLNSPKVGPHVEEWCEELDVKLVSEGIRSMAEMARDPDSKGHQAASKILMEKGFKTKRTAGRPTKKEKESHLAFDSRVADSVSDDLIRIKSIQ